MEEINHAPQSEWSASGGSRGEGRGRDEFYIQLLGSGPKCGFSLGLSYLDMLTHFLTDLEVAFDKEEVWAVIHSRELDTRWF
jgi:hypothetical protein